MKTNTSLKGKWGTVGAPPKAVKFPRGKFTIKKLFALNQGVCELTLRKRIDAAVAAGTITQLKETVRQDGVGRPNFLFQVNGSVKEFNKAASVGRSAVKATRKTRKVVTETVTTTPVAEVVPTPVPVATPVPATSTPVVNVVTPAPVVDDVTEGSEVPAAFAGSV